MRLRSAHLVLGAGLALVACGTTTATSSSLSVASSSSSTSTPSSSTTETSASTPTPAPTPAPKVGDTITTTDGHTYQVVQYTDHFRSTNEFNTPQPGGFFAAIKAKVCAGPTAIDLTNPADWVLVEPDDTQVSQANSAGLKQPDFPFNNLPAGQCAAGWINYDVTAKPKTVILQHSDLSWAIP